ncbi:hypothetical protein NDA11_001675 [Ustilago hordei]|uniref:FAR-17a/AIG1-like protein n=1 Tax=Ustilago hordei TaxID=120017 RepID=I2FVY4_USTHO|nr:uncharacterized protein UHO2_04598 [Ustilago hordei]KAJ1042582.1 hypothetical protein NDA10_003003 [Ustilago hordei]KAJ1578124.1 hypothetical protein NDA12_005431 [Ustilago hordei]KAJ1578265.1 hypothetical protein NDA11_001675 [Ustilago hordei]KAJ1592575.1 hypothetical protein NDA15_006596 [Ustilago hordei]KAJ1595753.1 hypothetical protein NDA14_002076 [Ustilago hordei]
MATRNKQPAALIWHLIAISSCIYGFKSLDVLPDLLGVSMGNEYGGFMQFLTMCGLVGTATTMGLALILDLVGGPEALCWLKDVLMAVSLPAETLITVMYWSIVAINKDLLMQPRKIMDPANPGQVLREDKIAVPFSIDASLHAFPGVFLLIDFFVFSRRLPKSIPIPVMAAVATFAYSQWAEKCAKMNGHFPYPLLDIMNRPQRFGFYAVCGVAAAIMGVLLTRLQANVKGLSHGQAGTRNKGKKRE